MDLEFINQITVLAGLAVAGVLQALKSLPILSIVNKHPVPSNVVLSVIASVIVVWNSGVVAAAVSVADWASILATIALTAAFTYNMLLSRSHELKSLERPENG